MQLTKGLYWEEVMQGINHNLNRRDLGANGMGKPELTEKGDQVIVAEIVRRLGVSC